MSIKSSWKAHPSHDLYRGQARKFRGKTMKEALSKAQSALGPKLYVIGTHIHKPWSNLLGLEISHAIPWYEVEAIPESAYKELPQSTEISDSANSLLNDKLKTIHRVVSHLENQGNDPLKLWDVPSSLIAPYQYLLRAGVEESYAERIVRHATACHDIRDLNHEPTAWQAVISAVADGISVAHSAQVQPDEKRVVLVVGPTGAGKTTSLAKMAAHFQLTNSGQVGLISCDMFRIAAVEQLDTYARIMNLPFAAAESAQTVADAAAQMDADLILIDTPGVSPLDQHQLNVLSELINVLSPDEVHLVLPLESAGHWAKLTREKFQVLCPDRLIITKTDEIDLHGGFINLAVDLRLPISFVSTGQHVPQDFLQADPDKISRMVMG